MIFKLSYHTLKQRQISLILMTLFILVNAPMVLYMLTTASGQAFDWRNSFPILTGVLLFLAAECWLLGVMVIKNLSLVSLEWHNQYLVRVNGYKKEHIPYRSFTKVRVIANSKRPERMIIKVYMKKKRLYLYGFEQMQQLHDLFTNLPIATEKKHQRIDWQHPSTLAAALLAATPVLALAAYQGEMLIDLLYPLVLMVLCVYLAIFRPLTRSVSQRFSRFESFASLLAGVLAVVSVVVNFI